jgi:DNA-binding MarR family transcriptional regulator
MTAAARVKPDVDSRPIAVADRLHSAAIHLLRSVRRQDRQAGVGPARLSALSVLVYRGPRTAGELAAEEQVKPPTMTRIVEALARDGFVRRLADEEDRRVVRLEATAKGRRLLDRTRRRRITRLATGVARLSERDRRLLLRAAHIMEEMARES